MDNTPKFTITEHIATLSSSTRSTLELNIVDWGSGGPKYDLRRWGTGPDGARIPYKGAVMTAYEMEMLKKILGAV